MEYQLCHRTNKKVSTGKFYPLGATLEENGVNFALYSEDAQEVYLLLFQTANTPPTDIIKLEAYDRYIWHVFVHGLKAGQLYAYKIKGEFYPEQGLRFNEHKLLIDPYAKALTGKLINENNLLLAYNPDSPYKDLTLDTRDNTLIIPKCIVINDSDFDWGTDEHPNIPMNELLIYEVHLKGFTASPTSKVRYPGTYLGFIEKIPYLKDLGITAVEFLPIHESYSEDYLLKKNLKNYWGYNTLCFFAPESSYSTKINPGCQVNEFKTLVRELHRAGIEVILDVVFNHSCEGNHLGPTACYRGIDNRTYYYLTGTEDQPARYYLDYTGCGNSLNASNPAVLRLITDSLRYWVSVMHVDGFRFDLASTLGRESGNFLKTSPFFDTIAQDPLLNRVKLIAEPWDLKSYEIGNFPADWAEWNGKFRDSIRKFMKSDVGLIGDAAERLFGSPDIYNRSGRSSFSSINFITCHDGFTLNDLVSYNQKHNEANGENNNDGSNDNNSWNCGTEGQTDDIQIKKLRKQLIKNFICSLLFSRGTPMMLGGDEFCRTQKGNNNAYCQDNELSWFDWSLLKENEDIYEFFKKAIRSSKAYRAFRRNKMGYGNLNPPNLKWFDKNLNYPDWYNTHNRTLCVQLEEKTKERQDFLIFHIVNSDWEKAWVKLPVLSAKLKWHRLIDTSLPYPQDFLDPQKAIIVDPADYYIINPRTYVYLFAGELK